MMCDKNARTRKQKQMRKRQFVNNEMVMDVQIDWSHLSVSSRTIWGRVTDADFTTGRRNDDGGAGGGLPALKPVNTTATDVNVLFETDFRNETSVGQEYTMKIEKTTKSSCTTEIENGVTRGVELTATLTIGDVLEAGAGFSREVSLTKTEGETLETEVSWGAESTVAVPAGKKASAQMQVLEKQQSGDFVVLTAMAGYVTVKYLSLKNGSLVFGHSGKIDAIVRHHVDQMKRQGKKFVGISFPDDSKVEFQTKGKCTFRYGIKQVVAVTQDKD